MKILFNFRFYGDKLLIVEARNVGGIWYADR